MSSNNRHTTPAFDVDAELEKAFAQAEQRSPQSSGRAGARPEPQIGQVDNIDLAGAASTNATPLKKRWWMWPLLALVALATGLLVTALAGGFDPAPVVIGGIEMLPTEATASSHASKLVWVVVGLGLVAFAVWYLKDKDRRKKLRQKPKKAVQWLYFKTLGRFFGHKPKEEPKTEAKKEKKSYEPESTASIEWRERMKSIVGLATVLALIFGAIATHNYLATVSMTDWQYGLSIISMVGTEAWVTWMVWKSQYNFAAKLGLGWGNWVGQIVGLLIPLVVLFACWQMVQANIYQPWLADADNISVTRPDLYIIWFKMAGCLLAPQLLLSWIAKALAKDVPVTRNKLEVARLAEEKKAKEEADAEARKEAEAARVIAEAAAAQADPAATAPSAAAPPQQP